MRDEFGNAAFIIKIVSFLLIASFINQSDTNSFVQKGFLAQSFGQFFKTVLSYCQHFAVWFKSSFRTCFVRLAGLYERRNRITGTIFLFINAAFAFDFQTQPFGQKINAGRANPVQTARNLVRVAVKFSPGVQSGHHDLRGGNTGFMFANRNAAPVVLNRHRIIEVDCDIDQVAISGQCFVYGVVHDFIHHLMQAIFVVVANIHARPQPDSVAVF